MDQQKLRTLRILEEIEKDGTPSQRDLSRKLNISLGLVNSFLKRLAHKGFCKATTIPKNRVRYLLTPKGATEKTRLTYEYIKSSINFYNKAVNKVEKLLQQLSENGIHTMALYGASDLAEIAYFFMQEASMHLVGIIDNNRMEKPFLKMKIVGSEQLVKMSFDKILITDIVEPLKAHDEIRSQGIPEDKIVMI